MCRVGPERKTLGSGLNAGNIGAEIDVIKPPCLPKLTLRSLFTSLSEFRALRSLIALLTLRRNRGKAGRQLAPSSNRERAGSANPEGERPAVFEIAGVLVRVVVQFEI